jgi:hypothetical protein
MALDSLERRIKSDAAYDRGTGLNFGWSNCQVKAGAFEPSLIQRKSVQTDWNFR